MLFVNNCTHVRVCGLDNYVWPQYICKTWAYPIMSMHICPHVFITPGALESHPARSFPRSTDIPSRADCRLTFASLLGMLRARYDLNHDFKKEASGVVVLSREGERWRRLIGESELVRLWNLEHARYVCLQISVFCVPLILTHSVSYIHPGPCVVHCKLCAFAK